VRIDLHTHSWVSDGTEPPAQVVASAAEAGLDVLALTDHDSTAGWDEARAAAQQHGVQLVPGMEISCSTAGGVSVHLLAYLADPASPGLLAEIERSRESRETRARRIVEKLSADVDISWDDVQAQISDGATIGRPHIADALVERGIVADRPAAFAGLLSARGPYYARHYSPDPVEAVALVTEAGGVAVMAHPLARKRGRVVDDEVIEQLADAGLAGLEADHRDNDDADRAHLRALAARLGLFVTGSSDYHGNGKPNLLGENTTAPEVLDEILARGTGAAVTA
jgi:predicted metal-dependent phosphoesterase TrpH